MFPFNSVAWDYCASSLSDAYFFKAQLLISAIKATFTFFLIAVFYPAAQRYTSICSRACFTLRCMMRHLSDLRFSDITETAPVMLTMMMIPFTASIADRIGYGIIFMLY